MKFFFSYPEVNGTEHDMLEPGALEVVAQAVERAGLDGLSLTDHPIPGARWLEHGGHQTLDPFVGLGFAAAATNRLRLVTHLSVAPYRNPFLLAKASATVDKLSGGRMILGVGVGYHKTEFFALGIDFDERNALFDEMLDVLPLHWHGEPFSYEGRHFDAREVMARPLPVQDPLPIWIGGNAKISRRRAAERAQGWMPMPGGPELTATTRTVGIPDHATLAGMIAEVQAAAAAVGRPPVEIAWTYLDRTLTDASHDKERHHEAFAELEGIGVTSLFISVKSHRTEETLEFIEAFGEEYVR